MRRTLAEADRAVANALATAIAKVFFFVAFFVAAAWIVTLFLPEIPLRKTHAVGL